MIEDYVGIMCKLPKFIQTYELLKPYKDLKKGTILVSESPWIFYTISGWYADKDSKLSKEYHFINDEELSDNLNFMDFYQYKGIKVSEKYLPYLRDNKIKTVRQLANDGPDTTFLDY
jgi:hypothetical protein